MIDSDKIRIGLINLLLPIAKRLGIKKISQEAYGLIRNLNFYFKPIKKGSAVFIGDSLIEQWAELEIKFENFKAINRGISGDTSRQLKKRLKSLVNTHNAEVIVILIGTNDINNEIPIDSIADNIQSTVDALSKMNIYIRILICEILPRKELHLVEKIRELNSKIAKSTQGIKNAVIVNTFDLFLDESGYFANDTLFIDGVHLNKSGYILLEKILNIEFNKMISSRI